LPLHQEYAPGNAVSDASTLIWSLVNLALEYRNLRIGKLDLKADSGAVARAIAAGPSRGAAGIQEGWKTSLLLELGRLASNEKANGLRAISEHFND
jgi:hypothetical protein